jgi:2-keto-4-pentenoate hydratase/2-oxohepta-3-ene-1,7-dioic acid hydratase in catechol pathway
LLLYRVAPEGFHAVRETADPEEPLRLLYSDPFEVLPGGWEIGREIATPPAFLPPLRPGKVIGIGRNYRAHAEELGNPMPAEPLLFLKAPSSVIGPKAPIVLPPESERVDFEGEIAVVVKRTLSRADRIDRDAARAAALGVTCACDVTARDLQKRDATFARAKSFDTFCPLGPAIRVRPDWDDLSVVTRVDGEERQRGHVREMAWDPLDLIVYVSRMMTLEPGDVILTGTPSGVGTLAEGNVLEVEIPGVGVLDNPVEAWRGGP